MSLQPGPSSAAWALILVLVLSIVFGLYYLGVVVALYETVPTDISAGFTAARPLSRSSEHVLVALSISWCGSGFTRALY
jgi:hypothetical protein